MLFRPDFIIVGSKALFNGIEGVHLVASNSVGQTEVDINWMLGETLQDLQDDPLGLRPQAHLRARLYSFSMVYAPDYRSAWERLIRMGNPDDSQPRVWTDDAIASPMKRLPPGA